MSDKHSKPYSVEELVTIGDYIHNAKTAFIVAVTPQAQDNKNDNYLGSFKGSRTEVVRMLVDVMRNNVEISNIIHEAAFTHSILQQNEVSSLKKKLRGY